MPGPENLLRIRHENRPNSVLLSAWCWPELDRACTLITMILLPHGHVESRRGSALRSAADAQAILRSRAAIIEHGA